LSAFSFPGKTAISIILLLLLAAGLFIWLIPNGRNPAYRQVKPAGRIDERDTMFSRNELVAGTENFKDYYRRHPKKKALDDRFRRNKGLLQKGTTQYHPFYFASADASFETIAALRDFVNGKVAPEKIPVEPEKISRYIKNWAKKLGAVDSGITELQDYHLYSTGGRGERYGLQFVKKHRYAIAFTVEMNHAMIQTAPAGTVVMESGQQYLESGRIALQVARFIRNLGYEARAHIDGSYEVVCPLVARDAGLGEIGRMGLLMTPKLGPRVRISVVTTNLPLVPDKPLHDYSFIDACVQCKKCAEVCPSNAISFNDREIINGSMRWQINQESCFTFWTIAGTDCGRCISVCPYSHPDNGLHNLVRMGMHQSGLFRKVALKMDDVYYGRKPAPKPVPEPLRAT
jgi:ferredoxin